jgi:transcriptional regulator with XRE-family HTH domain
MSERKRSSVLLGEEIRRARLAVGVTQEELAYEVKLDRTYISHLENGHKSPTVDVILRLCQPLGISASTLIAQVERSLAARRK